MRFVSPWWPAARLGEVAGLLGEALPGVTARWAPPDEPPPIRAGAFCFAWYAPRARLISVNPRTQRLGALVASDALVHEAIHAAVHVRGGYDESWLHGGDSHDAPHFFSLARRIAPALGVALESLDDPAARRWWPMSARPDYGLPALELDRAARRDGYMRWSDLPVSRRAAALDVHVAELLFAD